MKTSHCHLIYASKCDKSLSEFDLIRILYDASGGNARVGVSGVLIHKAGQFLQILEGDRFSINQIFSRIQNDTRHFSLEMIDVSGNSTPLSNDFMAYRNANSTFDLKYKPLFKDNFDFNTLKNHPATAYDFLKNIYHAVETPTQVLKYRKHKADALKKSGIIDAFRSNLSK